MPVVWLKTVGATVDCWRPGCCSAQASSVDAWSWQPSARCRGDSMSKCPVRPTASALLRVGCFGICGAFEGAEG